MAMELKNRMEGGLGCSIPVVKLLAGASVADLAAAIDAEIGTPGAPPVSDTVSWAKAPDLQPKQPSSTMAALT
jgi:hypothetical protein